MYETDESHQRLTGLCDLVHTNLSGICISDGFDTALQVMLLRLRPHLEEVGHFSICEFCPNPWRKTASPYYSQAPAPLTIV
jgi:hypothetical protein